MAEIERAPTRQDIARARRQLRFAKDELEKVSGAGTAGWHFWMTSLRYVEQTRTFMGRMLPEVPDDGRPGFTREPQDFPADQYSHRAMEAIKRAFVDEFAGEDAPNVTLVCTMPPDGRVAIATTEPDLDDALMALKAGWGAIHRTWRLTAERASR